MANAIVAECGAFQNNKAPPGFRPATSNEAGDTSGIIGKPFRTLANKPCELAGVWDKPVELIATYAPDHNTLASDGGDRVLSATMPPYCDALNVSVNWKKASCSLEPTRLASVTRHGCLAQQNQKSQC